MSDYEISFTNSLYYWLQTGTWVPPKGSLA
jgi:hypothetical protein